jgi:hypothetical protein
MTKKKEKKLQWNITINNASEFTVKPQDIFNLVATMKLQSV